MYFNLCQERPMFLTFKSMLLAIYEQELVWKPYRTSKSHHGNLFPLFTGQSIPPNSYY